MTTTKLPRARMFPSARRNNRTCHALGYRGGKEEIREKEMLILFLDVTPDDAINGRIANNTSMTIVILIKTTREIRARRTDE